MSGRNNVTREIQRHRRAATDSWHARRWIVARTTPANEIVMVTKAAARTDKLRPDCAIKSKVTSARSAALSGSGRSQSLLNLLSSRPQISQLLLQPLDRSP